MLRFLMLLIVVLAVAIVMPGCEDEGATTAADLEIQEGQRPKTRAPRPPPGPADGSFQEGDDSQIPGGTPDEPSDD